MVKLGHYASFVDKGFQRFFHFTVMQTLDSYQSALFIWQQTGALCLEDLTKVSLSYFTNTFNVVLVYLADACLLYTSPSPRDRQKSRMPSSA